MHTGHHDRLTATTGGVRRDTATVTGRLARTVAEDTIIPLVSEGTAGSADFTVTSGTHVTLLEATLTVDESDNGLWFGCDDLDSTMADCDSAHLSSRVFAGGGRDWEINGMWLVAASGTLQLQVVDDPPITEADQEFFRGLPLTLHLDSVRLSICLMATSLIGVIRVCRGLMVNKCK